MAKDQAHEQCNESLQMHGGTVRLYEDPEAPSLFMLAGPDCTRIVQEFDDINELQSSSTAHHEEKHSLQVKIHKDVRSFISVVEKLGNPFLAKSQELVALDTSLSWNKPLSLHCQNSMNLAKHVIQHSFQKW